MLLSLRLAIKPEIPIEGHALWVESDESDPHADRCGGEGGNSKLCASSENLAPNGKREEIEAINKQVRILQEIIDCLRSDAGIKPADPDFGIDRACHLFENRGFVTTDRGHDRTNLTVEVDEFELVEVSDGERTNSQAGKCQEMDAADPAHPSDRNSLGPKCELFKVGDEPEVAVERQIVWKLAGFAHQRCTNSDAGLLVSGPRGFLTTKCIQMDPDKTAQSSTTIFRD